jgi:hypothetical protein
MLSFPSSEHQPLAEDPKGAASPCSTTVSTLHEPFPRPFFLHPRAQTPPDWTAFQDAVLSWFAEKGVVAGRPEELVAEHRESQRKMITLANKKSETESGSTLGRRLGRKLTISL